MKKNKWEPTISTFINNLLLQMLKLFLTLDRSSIYHSLELQLREEQKYILMQWSANSLNFK